MVLCVEPTTATDNRNHYVPLYDYKHFHHKMICIITLSNSYFSFEMTVKLTITCTKHNELGSHYIYMAPGILCQNNVFFCFEVNIFWWCAMHSGHRNFLVVGKFREYFWLLFYLLMIWPVVRPLLFSRTSPRLFGTKKDQQNISFPQKFSGTFNTTFRYHCKTCPTWKSCLTETETEYISKQNISAKM